MIEIYQGRIGGGKTYAAVSEIASHLAKGGVVYSNIEIVNEGMARLVAKRHGVYFHPESLRSLPENVWGWQDAIEWGTRKLDVLVVIDEAQVFYNSRDYARTAKEHGRMLSFLTQSRKACVSVIFITQHAENIDRQFRLLAQNAWQFRDMGKFGPLAPIFGRCFLAVAHDYCGERLGSKLVWKDARVFKAYDTWAFLDQQMREASAGLRAGVDPYRLQKVGFLKRFFGRTYFKRTRYETVDRANPDWSLWLARLGQNVLSRVGAISLGRGGEGGV